MSETRRKPAFLLWAMLSGCLAAILTGGVGFYFATTSDSFSERCLQDDGTPVFKDGEYSHCKMPDPIYTDDKGNVIQP